MNKQKIYALEKVFKEQLSLLEGSKELRGGLIETPLRAAKAWCEWTKGYGQHPNEILKTFEDGAENYDGILVVKDIPFYSHCEHHLAPIFGTASIAYIPKDRIVGLSKFSRLVDIYAKRLQVQERMTTQIVEAIDKVLSPVGVGCVVKARHLCMESRGICKQGTVTLTSCLRGVFKTDLAARSELMEVLK